MNENAVWKEVIINKYGNTAVGKVELGEECKPWYASLWWKDVCSIGKNLNLNWFTLNAVKNLVLVMVGIQVFGVIFGWEILL
jgi:hypothetical protein